MLKKAQTIKVPESSGARLDIQEHPEYLCETLKNLLPDQIFELSDVKSLFECFLDPNLFEDRLRVYLGPSFSSVIISGSVEDRILFLSIHNERSYIISFGQTLNYLFSADEIHSFSIATPNSTISMVLSEKDYFEKIQKTTVFLASLYHPEVFPLPRFPLGISDLAYAIRKKHLGKVRLADMQLGVSINDIINEILVHRPKIIGISSTFGQHDILEKIIGKLNCFPEGYHPIFIFGGSLSALNSVSILNSLPTAFISLGPGERTITDLVQYSNGEITKDEICGVAYLGEFGEIRKTPNLNNRNADDILPELDLLPATLIRSGVMQLESSRGCSYACSFCPRTHKGIWSGESSSAINGLMPYISSVFDKYPNIARKIFLVDEEFFGYHSLSESRVTDISRELQSFGFKFETSSRIDQVYRPQKDQAWHIHRLDIWRVLLKNLSRCLFGVESGVNSILQRFNKKTTTVQNVTAIRLLSLLGIPTRFTYITFDPLMSFNELIETFQFISRTDLICSKNTGMSSSNILDIALNIEDFPEILKNIPFYHTISYMLVSMECLEGSEYTKLAESAGLLLTSNLQMGRVNSRYNDPIIGLFSHHCQLWIDRNFPLDYLLKSLQKIHGADISKLINRLRLTLKDYSYQLLGEFINLEVVVEVYDKFDFISENLLRHLKHKWLGASIDHKSHTLLHILDLYSDSLKLKLLNEFEGLKLLLPSNTYQMLSDALVSWDKNKTWRLINE